VCFGYGPAAARDGGTEFGVRSQDAVVAVAVDARGRYAEHTSLDNVLEFVPVLGL
jgi:hypothetical protein